MKIDISQAIEIHAILKRAEGEIFSQTGCKVDLHVLQGDHGEGFNLPVLALSVSRVLSIPLKEMVSSSRKQDIKEARQICIYLATKYLPGYRHKSIAELFNLDRSSVAHSIKFCESMIHSKDEQFNNKLMLCKDAVKKIIDEN